MTVDTFDPQRECQTCDDTGFQLFTCSGTTGECWKAHPHRPHDYVKRCWCRSTNKTWQAKQQRAA